MEQYRQGNDVALKDVQTNLGKEECVPDMEQRSSNAAVKDVRIKLRKEECVKVMVQSGQYVVVKVVQVRLSKEECASGMEQRLGSNDAASSKRMYKPRRVCI